MYIVGLIIALFSYSIYFLGIFHLLYSTSVAILTILAIVGIAYVTSIRLRRIKLEKFGLITKVMWGLIILQGIVNLLGALGPELGFDALWYHLTIPKLFIQMHAIQHIPGGLYYYSDMPKLIDMLYIPALLFSNEVIAKIIHFSLGILTLFILFNLARKYLSQTYAILVVLVFYANLVVGWESTTAYIDLGRTFYELLSFTAFITWVEQRKVRYLLLAAVLVGCALSTKLLSAGSLIIFFFLINYIGYQRRLFLKHFLSSLLFVLISILTVSPYLIFSYIYTGNPVYPFFSNLYPIMANSSVNFFNDFLNLFLFSADPVSPIYLICIPLIFLIWKRLKRGELLILIYCILAIIVSLHTPQTGGGRFIMAYLPVLSLFIGIIIQVLPSIQLKTYIVGLCIVISIVSVVYRGVANARYIPVIIGKESKADFLTNHLNFNFGDFYDTDRYISNHMRVSDKILVLGGHNLYYIDVPFVHESFVNKGEKFSYIMVIEGTLPYQYTGAKLIHTDKRSHMMLYKKEGKPWVY